MQLFVCCADERGSMAACDACDVTPWLALAQHGALPHPKTLNACENPLWAIFPICLLGGGSAGLQLA